MASVCQLCGVNGYPELLVYCIHCRVSAQHFYCLDRGKENIWSCENCKQRTPELPSLNKLNCKVTSPKQPCNVQVKDNIVRITRAMSKKMGDKENNVRVTRAAAKKRGIAVQEMPLPVSKKIRVVLMELTVSVAGRKNARMM